MIKKARLIITFDCPRSCDYCCNNYTSIMTKAKNIVSLNQLSKYNEILITGGEPSTYAHTLHILHELRTLYPFKTIYLYTAKFTLQTLKIITQTHDGKRLINGIHYTLHKDSTLEDIEDFHKLQNPLLMTYYKNISCRLYINPNIAYPITIYPYIWKQVKISPWIEEKDLVLPKHEDLLILTRQEKNKE